MLLGKNNRLRSAAVLVTSVALLASMAQTSSASGPEAPVAVAPPPSTEAEDRAAAADAATRQGTPVESLADRTETSTTWANSDGTFKTDYFGAPIRFRDSSGEWRDVDISLVKLPDGTVAPKAHPDSLEFAPAGGTTNTVRDLATIDGGDLVLGWKGPLPEPVIDGFTATYREVQPGVDLVLTATRTGFEQFFVIKERPEPGAEPTFHLPVTGDDISVKETAQGGLAILDETGKKVAVAPTPLMWGDTLDPKSGEPAEQAAVDISVTRTAEGGEVLLKPDPTFLADPSVTYPLVVDPAVTVYTSSDTLIQNDISSNQNGGVELKAGSYNGGTTKARSLIKFNIGGLQSDAGTKILSADFLVYNYYSSSCTKTPVGLHRVTSSWSPSSVVWGSGTPTYVSTALATETAANGYNANCPDGYIHFDNEGIRSLVEGWANGTTPNYGVLLKAGNENDSLSWKRFHSADYGGVRVPRISVTYNSLPYQPGGRKVTACATCAHATAQSAPRPFLWGNAKDDDGGSLRMDYEIWDGGTQAPTSRRSYGSKTVTVATNSATAVAWAPPADLPDGTFGYRVRAWDGQHFGPWSDGFVVFSIDTNAAPATAESLSSTPPVSCLTGTARPKLDTPSPTLRASAADPDGDAVRMNFEVWSLSGSAPAVTGASPLVSSGSRASWSVPASALQVGLGYKWRARANDGSADSAAWSPWCEFDVTPAGAAPISAPDAAQVLAEVGAALPQEVGASGAGDSDSALVTQAEGVSVDVPRNSEDEVLITLDEGGAEGVSDIESGSATAPAPEPVVDGSADGPVELEPGDDPTDVAPTAAPAPAPAVTIGVRVPAADTAADGLLAEAGTVVYTGTAPATSQAVQQTSTGVTRFFTVINSQDAPTEFPYELTLPENSELKLLEDGAVAVVPLGADLDTGPLAVIARPWALDADGKALPVSYSFSGATLTLHVTHGAGTVYPVTADPALPGHHMFSPADPTLTASTVKGTFGMQVNYADMSHLTTTWYFQLSPAKVREWRALGASIVQGDMKVRVAGRDIKGWKYNSHFEPPDYIFHAAFTGKYYYKDDHIRPKAHYLRGYMGLRFWIDIQVHFRIDANNSRTIHFNGRFQL